MNREKNNLQVAFQQLYAFYYIFKNLIKSVSLDLNKMNTVHLNSVDKYLLTLQYESISAFKHYKEP